MAFVTDDRVLDTTTTTGTGNVTMSGAPPGGFQQFTSVMSVGDYCHYCIVGGTEWEVGLGELMSGGSVTSVLARRQVYSSSNNDALVNFSAGSKSIFITQPGHRKGSPVLYVSTSSAQVNNSTTEATLIGGGVGSLTFPANSLFIGRTLRIKLSGIISTAAISPGTLRIKVKLGTTVILDTGAQTITSSLSNMVWRIEASITVRSTGSGSGGSVFAQSAFEHQVTALAALLAWAMTNTAAVNMDTTISNALDVTATWGTADASNSILCTNCTLESLN